jgi:hypothetical protein
MGAGHQHSKNSHSDINVQPGLRTTEATYRMLEAEVALRFTTIIWEIGHM